MNVTAAETLRRGTPRGPFALVRSYVADLRGWLVRRATGYGIVAALMLGGVLAVFGAVAVGIIALYHFVALRYGANIGYTAIGGGLLLVGIILLLVGWAITRRKAPPLPRPTPQFRAARQMVIGTTIARAVGAMRRNEAERPDATTQVMLGVAAILALGWIVATHLRSVASDGQARR